MEKYEGKIFLTVEEANEQFAAQSEECREIQEISDKIISLIWALANKRRSMNLSQRDFAKQLGLKQPALARFERLEAMPRLDTFIKVARKLGFNVYLESFDGKPIPPECFKIAVETVKESPKIKNKKRV